MAYTTIDKPDDYFNTVLYTGNGVGGTNITGVGFQPDLVWIKRRSDTEFHVWNDAVRGVPKNIYSNSTNAEDSGSLMSAIISDGFTVQTDGSVNGSGSTYVAWNWLANNTSGSSNTAGSITSTVAANTTSGFSIVSYTGTGANATVGHGLGVAPKMIIIKNRDSAENWIVGGSNITTGWTGYLALNLTDNITTASNIYQNTVPTSSFFYIGDSGKVNGSTHGMVAYCFAEVKGFSKFGSYIGNGSADGPFVYTGFKPAFVMWKRTDSAGYDWDIYDSARDTYNLAFKELLANAISAESASTVLSFDMLSNGFKLRTSNPNGNASGGTYIYMAFAENPFVTSTSIPTTAR